MSDNEDQYAERLREVLHQEGSGMGTSDDGLNRILSQAHESGGSGGGRSRSWLAPLAVAAAAVLLIGGLGIGIGLARSGGDDHNAAAVDSSSAPVVSSSTSVAPSITVSSSQPSPAVSTSSSASTSTAAPATAAVPIYYVADMNSKGNRLYREFHTLPIALGRPLAAVTELFDGTAADPDYGTLWPAGTRSSTLTISGDLATVDVSDFPTNAKDQAMAVQQLVWTVTGADPTVKRVQLTVNGQTPSSSALAKPVGRASAFVVQADVWITAPTEGASEKSPVRLTVYGTGFEGNVPFKVFCMQSGAGTATCKSTDVAIVQGALTTQMGAFAQASTSIALRPGSYQIRAYNEGGKDGTLLLWDTKTFTVG